MYKEERKKKKGGKKKLRNILVLSDRIFGTYERNKRHVSFALFTPDAQR